MNDASIVILGGGMVAGYAAREMIDAGLKGSELAIFSNDSREPYERPPLSKSFLAGKDTEEAIRISPPVFYRDHGIQLKLGTEVSAIDGARRRLTLKSGNQFGFEKLIIATGAQPRPLAIPGGHLPHVHYLRSVDDSKAIQESAQSVLHAVVIGGGFIGMEVASVLAQKPIEVTMVLREDRLGKSVFSPEMSAFFEAYYFGRGVKFLKNTEVSELRGNGTVREAVLRDGSTLPCTMAVAGIGVLPATDVLIGSGIEVADGVVVNEYLEASREDVYAAGDVANYYDVLWGKRRRVEHWDNAVSQGRHVAHVVMGERTPFRHVPYFFSDVFDLSYEYWGDASGAEQVIHRGDVTTSSFSTWWLREDRVVAAFVMNRPDEEREAAPQWIESRQKVSGERLKDAKRALTDAVA